MSEPTSYTGQPAAPRPLGAGMAITALVLGILALLLSWTVIGGILLGLVAIVLGAIASRRAKRGMATGRGMAITGLLLGLLGFVISVALVAAGAWFLNSDKAKNLQDCLHDAGSDQSAVKQCQQDFKRDLEGN